MDPFGATLGALGIGFVLIVLLFVLLTTVFWIVELIDVLRREFPDPTMKIVWLLVIFFSHVIGAIIYYFVGKPSGRIPPPYNNSM